MQKKIIQNKVSKINEKLKTEKEYNRKWNNDKFTVEKVDGDNLPQLILDKKI